MICYQDKTFCVAPCANDACDRKITEEDQEKSEKTGLPFSLSDFSNNCPVYQPLEEDNEIKN